MNPPETPWDILKAPEQGPGSDRKYRLAAEDGRRKSKRLGGRGGGEEKEYEPILETEQEEQEEEQEERQERLLKVREQLNEQLKDKREDEDIERPAIERRGRVKEQPEVRKTGMEEIGVEEMLRATSSLSRPESQACSRPGSQNSRPGSALPRKVREYLESS